MTLDGTIEIDVEPTYYRTTTPGTCKPQHEVRKKSISMFPCGQSFWLRASILHFIIGIFVIALFTDWKRQNIPIINTNTNNTASSVCFWPQHDVR